MAKKEVIEIYDAKKGKWVKVGTLKDGIYERRVNPEKHLMRKIDCYGIQEEAVKILQARGCDRVRLITKTETLESDFAAWLAPDIRVMDYGHGKQRFYPVYRMRRQVKG